VTVWRLAWRSALRRRRLFLWNVAIPLVLLTPVALSAAAAPHRVAVFGVFIVFFASFGSAIPAVRDAEEGWLDQVLRTGYGARRWLIERTLAEAGIDLVQTAPAVLVLLVAAGGLTRAPVVLLALAFTLVFANLLGPAIAALVRSLAEAALACAALSLVLLHYAGFFRAPSPGWTSTVAAWNPYSPFRAALSFGVSGIESAAAVWSWALIPGVVVGLVLLATAGRWTRWLRWPFSA